MAVPVSIESAALARMSGNKASTALVLYELGGKLKSMGKQYWSSNFAYRVSVAEGDVLYADVYDWLMSIMPNEKHRSLKVSTGNGARVMPSDSSETPETKSIIVRFNDKSERIVNIDGFRVKVLVYKPETPQNSSQYTEPEPKQIEFVTNSYLAQQAIIKHLARLNDERSTSRKAVLRMVGQWGSWKTRSDLPPRTLDSVSLPEDQKARIVADLATFLDSEDQYNRLALPWHRGYMFHGPPGTGKTSLVKALANEFNLDLWYISLADLKAESSLLGLLAEVGPRSLLLLEDIDTMRITHDRDSSEQGTISMSSLLNTLDGVATPHGLITIMTTNRFDILDTALTRAGRMDMIEELDYPKISTLVSLYTHFYGRQPNWSWDDDVSLVGLSAAEVAEVFKRHMTDPVGAEQAVESLLFDRVRV